MIKFSKVISKPNPLRDINSLVNKKFNIVTEQDGRNVISISFDETKLTSTEITKINNYIEMKYPELIKR